MHGPEVRIQSHQAHTDVDLHLKDPHSSSPSSARDKVAVQATGRDFDLKVKCSDVGVQVAGARFQGQVHPNDKLQVQLSAQRSAGLDVQVKSEGVTVQSSAPLKGHFGLKDKVDADFTNQKGFHLKLVDGHEQDPGGISAKVPDLNVQGRVQSSGIQAEIKGQGDFQLDVANQGGPVQIGYTGELKGSGQAQEFLDGELKLTGPVKVALQQKDLDLDIDGPVQVGGHSPRFGVDLNLEQPTGGLQVNLKDQKLSLKTAGGTLSLEHLKALKLDDSPKLKEILEKLNSRSATLTYHDLEMDDNGKALKLQVQSQGLETHYGNVDLDLKLTKSGPHL